jgi:hypothetical protein
LRPDSILFGESRPLVVISFSPDKEAAIRGICEGNSISFGVIGETGGDRLIINSYIDLPVAELNELYESAIPSMMEKISH